MIILRQHLGGKPPRHPDQGHCPCTPPGPGWPLDPDLNWSILPNHFFQFPCLHNAYEMLIGWLVCQTLPYVWRWCRVVHYAVDFTRHQHKWGTISHVHNVPNNYSVLFLDYLSDWTVSWSLDGSLALNLKVHLCEQEVECHSVQNEWKRGMHSTVWFQDMFVC